MSLLPSAPNSLRNFAVTIGLACAEYLEMKMTVVIVLLLSIPFILAVIYYCLKQKIHASRRRSKKRIEGGIVGIFHPYCNAGGGGERVLWCAVRAIQKNYPNLHIAIYTGDVVPPEQMLKNAEKKFNIQLSQDNLEFILLKKRNWVEAKRYPAFTLLGQSLGSIILGFEAIFELVPDIFIDTMGYSFTYPIFSILGNSTVLCYVHYPTISTDMLHKVASQSAAFNNSPFISKSPFLSQMKLFYYRLFAFLYGLSGKCANSVMVNSSWTEEHINEIWSVPLKTYKVYPPCDVSEFLKIPTNSDPQLFQIIAIAQFRPEKDHPMMIRSFYKLIDILTDEERSRVKLVLVGSCRNEEDRQRVEDYRRLSKHFNVDSHIDFRINVEFEELKQLLQESTIGLHAMWNEHFGISIVECMAAGLIMVAHNSGGPMMDIIIHSKGSQPIGFLASDELEYAHLLCSIIRMPSNKRELISQSARNSVSRFSDETFEAEFLKITSPYFNAMSSQF